MARMWSKVTSQSNTALSGNFPPENYSSQHRVTVLLIDHELHNAYFCNLIIQYIHLLYLYVYLYICIYKRVYVFMYV